MVQSVMEIAISDIGENKVEDESTEAGQKWRGVWRNINKVPGFEFAAWGRSLQKPNVMNFCIDWQTYYHHEQLMEGGPVARGSLAQPILDVLEGRPFDMYHIHPSTTDRKIFFAPHTQISFFWGIDEPKFFMPDMWAEFATSIEKSDNCVGYIWGECRNPPHEDPSGNMALGKGGIMISGWTSREAHDRDVAKSRVKDGFKKVCTATKRSYTYGIMFRAVTQGGDEMSWRRL